MELSRRRFCFVYLHTHWDTRVLTCFAPQPSDFVTRSCLNHSQVALLMFSLHCVLLVDLKNALKMLLLGLLFLERSFLFKIADAWTEGRSAASWGFKRLDLGGGTNLPKGEIYSMGAEYPNHDCGSNEQPDRLAGWGMIGGWRECLRIWRGIGDFGCHEGTNLKGGRQIYKNCLCF